MLKIYNIGDIVTYNGQKCTVTRRNSMTLSNGRAMHRYNLRGEFGSFLDIYGDDVGDVIEFMNNNTHPDFNSDDEDDD